MPTAPLSWGFGNVVRAAYLERRDAFTKPVLDRWIVWGRAYGFPKDSPAYGPAPRNTEAQR